VSPRVFQVNGKWDRLPSLAGGIDARGKDQSGLKERSAKRQRVPLTNTDGRERTAKRQASGSSRARHDRNSAIKPDNDVINVADDVLHIDDEVINVTDDVIRVKDE
jgi:hypothetical protein